MTVIDLRSRQWSSRVLSVLRIVAGAMLMLHGTQKLFGFPPSQPPMPTATLASLMGVAGVLETLGGALILVGLLTRPVAFLLSGELAVAYFKAHFPAGWLPIQNHGELAVLYSFLFLYFTFAGPGVWSIDHAIARRRDHSEPVTPSAELDQPSRHAPRRVA